MTDPTNRADEREAMKRACKCAENFVSESNTLPFPEHGGEELNDVESAVADEMALCLHDFALAETHVLREQLIRERREDMATINALLVERDALRRRVEELTGERDAALKKMGECWRCNPRLQGRNVDQFYRDDDAARTPPLQAAKEKEMAPSGSGMDDASLDITIKAIMYHMSKGEAGREGSRAILRCHIEANRTTQPSRAPCLLCGLFHAPQTCDEFHAPLKLPVDRTARIQRAFEADGVAEPQPAPAEEMVKEGWRSKCRIRDLAPISSVSASWTVIFGEWALHINGEWHRSRHDQGWYWSNMSKAISALNRASPPPLPAMEDDETANAERDGEQHKRKRWSMDPGWLRCEPLYVDHYKLGYDRVRGEQGQTCTQDCHEWVPGNGKHAPGCAMSQQAHVDAVMKPPAPV